MPCRCYAGLDPAPGEQIGESQVDYAVPDVIVRQHQGRWQVSLNEEVLPQGQPATAVCQPGPECQR